MKNMYLDDGKELVKMFRRMKEHEIATSLDLAAVDPASEAGKADWRSILQTVLPYVDFFVPSFEELCFMLDRERFDRLNTGTDMTAGLDLLKEAMPLAEEAIQLGCRAVLLKCGISGMVYKTSGAEAFKKIGSRLSLNTASWASQEGVQKCFRVEHVCSGTGAGDTSIAAFLTGVMKGYPPSECVLLGAAEGACCVMGYDALSALRPIEELRERIRLGWPVI